MAALTRLAALTKAEPDSGLLIACADALEDLSPRTLELAFAHLEKSWAVPGTLPMPEEIREIGTRRRANERQAEERDLRELHRRGTFRCGACEDTGFIMIGEGRERRATQCLCRKRTGVSVDVRIVP